MQHKVRWTEKKVAQRLALIEPLVYRRSAPLPPFRYTTLPDPLAAPLVDASVDDAACCAGQPAPTPLPTWASIASSTACSPTIATANSRRSRRPMRSTIH